MAHNCGELLRNAYERIPKELFDEIICIDDGSTDNTLLVAQQIGLKAFTHAHGGYGTNIKFGLKKAVELGADCIIEIHGDGQYDASYIGPATQKLRDGCDFILGNRFYILNQPLKDGMGLIRYFGNFLLSRFAKIILRIKPPDIFTGLRGYSKRLVETVDLSKGSDDYFFSFEIVAQAKYAGLTIDWVPTRCYYTGEHHSMNLWKGVLEIFQMSYTLLLYILARLGIKLGVLSSQKRVG